MARGLEGCEACSRSEVGVGNAAARGLEGCEASGGGRGEGGVEGPRGASRGLEALRGGLEGASRGRGLLRRSVGSRREAACRCTAT